jgi:hypothetical protein
VISVPQSLARLQFLARVATKEGTHLQSTDQRLFAERFTELRARSLDDDPALAERVEAFVARFGRCQRHGWLAGNSRLDNFIRPYRAASADFS